jgi:uncharacterized membrane protein
MSQIDIHTGTATRTATSVIISALGLLCFPSVLKSVSQISILWPVASILGAVALTIMTWLTINYAAPSVTAHAGWMGIFAIFGQLLDAVSTAIGIDILSLSEQVPLSRAVLEFAATLPSAPIIGVGWLFVVLKLTLATGLVWLVSTDNKPMRISDYVLFLGAGLVGLLPGLRNLILYTVP